MNETNNFRNEKGQFTKGNQYGRIKKTSRNTLILQAAMELVAKQKGYDSPLTLELAIAVMAVENALKGEFAFYKDIMDRLYGKAKISLFVEQETETETENSI